MTKQHPKPERRITNEPQRRLWNALLKDYEENIATALHMDKWADFLSGVTAYDDEITCTWNDHQEVFLDSDAPYVNDPHPDFPYRRGDGAYLRYEGWSTPDYYAPGMTNGDRHQLMEDAPPPPEMPLSLDVVVDQTTASDSMRELVQAMRAGKDHGQGYTPTLQPDRYSHDPALEKGLHAVRAEAQRLGFRVYPDDSEYTAPKAPAENGLDHPEPPALDDVGFAPEDLADWEDRKPPSIEDRSLFDRDR